MYRTSMKPMPQARLGVLELRLLLLALITPLTLVIGQVTRVSIAREATFVISLLVLMVFLFDYFATQGLHFYPRALRCNNWLWAWLLVGIYTIAVALFRQNEYYFWMYSDIYRYVVAVLIAILYLARKRTPRLAEVLPMLVVVESLAAFFVVYTSLTGSYIRTGNSGSLLFPLSLTFLLTGTRVLWPWGVVFLLETLRIVLSQSRTLLVQTMGCVVLIPVVVSRFCNLRGQRLFRLALVAAVGLAAISVFVPGDRITAFTNRVLSLQKPLRDVSLQGRLDEARIALEHLMDEGTAAVLFGTGVGSTYYFPGVVRIAAAPIYVETKYQVHNIHIGPVSVLFRTGMIGLCILYVPLFVIPIRIVVKAKTPCARAIGLFLLMKAFESIQTLRFIGDPVLLILMALANYDLRTPKADYDKDGE